MDKAWQELSHPRPLKNKAANTILRSCRFVFILFRVSFDASIEGNTEFCYGTMRQLLLGFVGMVLFRSSQSIINSRISSLER